MSAQSSFARFVEFFGFIEFLGFYNTRNHVNSKNCVNLSIAEIKTTINQIDIKKAGL
ncbi:MAG: hypothetical protein HZA07_01510 [Nitrospirae bacterium]|nr:hypothetical protein [Nitrospirota bacterium]